MTIEYRSDASKDILYRHLPEAERPERLSAHIIDEEGNVFLFVVDESRTVKPTDLFYSEMANGNRYGDWVGSKLITSPVILHPFSAVMKAGLLMTFVRF